MLKVILALLSLSSISAVASELPSVKSAPISISPPLWTGFYAGLNAGGTWASNNNVHIIEIPTWINPLSTAKQSASITAAASQAGSSISIPIANNVNFIGGGQLGYNEKIHDKVVVGVETDIQGIVDSRGIVSTIFQAFGFQYYSVNLNRINTETIYNLFSASKNLSYIGTFRGRAGFLVHSNLLMYWTGGFAYGGINLNTFGNQQIINTAIRSTGPGQSNFSGAHLGWTAGGGVEWMFTQNLSMKAEYLYYSLNPVSLYMGQDLRSRSISGSGLSTGDISTIFNFIARTNFSGNIVRAGVNYHFNFASGPSVFKF